MVFTCHPEFLGFDEFQAMSTEALLDDIRQRLVTADPESGPAFDHGITTALAQLHQGRGALGHARKGSWRRRHGMTINFSNRPKPRTNSMNVNPRGLARLGMILALLVAARTTVAETGAVPPVFLVPGDYHGSEAPASLGPGWLALVPMTGSWQLVPARARIEPVRDAVLDDEDQATARRIAVEGDAIALIRLPEVHPGKATTPNMRFKGVARSLVAGAPLDIAFNDSQYRLEVSNSEVYLRRGHRATPLGLFVGDKDSDADADLRWAGDLDGDGQLDLLVAYGGSNSGGTCLYLSTKASPGELVRRVACHNATGC
jgi:hypothetical protein